MISHKLLTTIISKHIKKYKKWAWAGILVVVGRRVAPVMRADG